jgi:plasmid stability protein
MAEMAGRGSDQYMVRFPEGMRDRLKAAAAENGRSMNTEIIARLEQSFEPYEPRTAELKAALAIVENFTAQARAVLSSAKLRQIAEENPEVAEALGFDDLREKDGGKVND